VILDHSVIQNHRTAASILVLAHVLVGEPDSTSPRHAPAASLADFIEGSNAEQFGGKSPELPVIPGIVTSACRAEQRCETFC
jgi:hypothetical protein